MKLPSYYLVGVNLVKAVETDKGGMDILALDFKTGEFVRAMQYLSTIMMPEQTDLDMDTDELSEAEFNKKVEEIRKQIKKKT